MEVACSDDFIPGTKVPGFYLEALCASFDFLLLAGKVRFFHAKDIKTGTLAKYVREDSSEDLDEMRWRFDNRSNQYLCDTLLAPVLKYKELTVA